MISWGFEYGPGGNKNGSGDFIDRLTAAGAPQCFKGTDDAGLCYQAQETGHPDSVLIYRVSTAGQNNGIQYDVPKYELSPANAAEQHFQVTAAKWPTELLPARVWMEPVNEIRAKPDPNKPNYNNMHPCDWIGNFMTDYAVLANANGFKVCGPAFNSGEPEPADYSQPGMLRWLAYCAENPDKAALSVHEYAFDLLPYANSYPWKYGRFQAAIAAADLAGIPRTFRIFVTEFGWTLDTVPNWQTAETTILPYTQLSAKFPQLQAAAIWSLRSGWGGISDQLSAWIGEDGNPLANWIISNQYPTAVQPQATAAEFGATLPTQQPPDGGGGAMTLKWIRKLNDVQFFPTDPTATHLQVSFIEKQAGQPDGAATKIDIPIPPGTGILRIHEMREEPDEPVNPNPPPVVLTLPQGSKGVDVSYWQGSYNWAESGAEFGIIRCSDGMTANTMTHDGNGIDRMFFANAEKLTALGIPWSVYHFLRPSNIQSQAAKVRAALNVLADDGMSPRTAVFDNGVKLPAVWVDVEDGSLTSANVQEFYNLLAADHHTGIYTGKPIWEQITASAAVWWASVPLWIAAYGVNDGNVPPWANGPFLPRGWDTAVLWQYSSNPVDKNIAGPYPLMGTQPPSPPSPTGQTYNTSFMRAAPSAWRVIRRFDGSGEDVWDLPLDGKRFVRVKNTVWGEWYNGNMRERDTSPAPQSDGTERLYLLNGGAGGQIAPETAVVGVTYNFPNYVQFKAKQGCADLAENSGTAVSAFLLKEVIDNYTFPSTGFTVDRLFWTVQTGENQLYAVKDGVNIGWVGGGASQDNNVWGGALAELYFDRAIPQQEPEKYCE